LVFSECNPHRHRQIAGPRQSSWVSSL
jgi:hypothetical protein